MYMTVQGHRVRGWNPFTTKGRVTDPVKFFRVRGKDYLFAADDQTVYLLDRTGNIRVNLQEPLKKAAGSAVRFISDDVQSLVFTVPDGSVIQLSLDGAVKKRRPGAFSPDHRFDCYDISGDGLSDYIFLDSGLMSVFGNDGIEIFTRSFDSGSLDGPLMISFSSSDIKTGVYEFKQKMLHLTGKTGASMQGFPRLSGQYFTIGRLANRSAWILLTDENDSYLYNYELPALK